MTNIASMLELIRTNYMLGKVKVLVLKDAGPLLVDNETIILKRGYELEIPRFLAEILAEKGIVSFKDEILGIEDIARIHYNEMNIRSPAGIDELPENFYQRALDYMKKLDKELKETVDPALFEEKKRAEIMLKEILFKRLSLLLQLILSPMASYQVLAKLSDEEKVLYELLEKSINKWISIVAPYLTREESATKAG